jgi:hypothetical protein
MHPTTYHRLQHRNRTSDLESHFATQPVGRPIYIPAHRIAAAFAPSSGIPTRDPSSYTPAISALVTLYHIDHRPRFILFSSYIQHDFASEFLGASSLEKFLSPKL